MAELIITHHANGTWTAEDTRIGRVGAGATRAQALRRLATGYSAWVSVAARKETVDA